MDDIANRLARLRHEQKAYKDYVKFINKKFPSGTEIMSKNQFIVTLRLDSKTHGHFHETFNVCSFGLAIDLIQTNKDDTKLLDLAILSFEDLKIELTKEDKYVEFNDTGIKISDLHKFK